MKAEEEEKGGKVTYLPKGEGHGAVIKQIKQ